MYYTHFLLTKLLVDLPFNLFAQIFLPLGSLLLLYNSLFDLLWLKLFVFYIKILSQILLKVAEPSFKLSKYFLEAGFDPLGCLLTVASDCIIVSESLVELLGQREVIFCFVLPPLFLVFETLCSGFISLDDF